MKATQILRGPSKTSRPSTNISSTTTQIGEGTAMAAAFIASREIQMASSFVASGPRSPNTSLHLRKFPPEIEIRYEYLLHNDNRVQLRPLLLRGYNMDRSELWESEKILEPTEENIDQMRKCFSHLNFKTTTT